MWRPTISSDELYHHGILGQKWGKKNGPPYPLNPNTDYSKEEITGKSLKKSGLLPKNATHQNVQKWGKSPNTNVLYITGLSGSGKSTVAKKLKKKNVEVVHLDSYFDNIDGPHNKDFDEYLNKNKSDYKRIQTPKNEISINDWGKVVERFEQAIEDYGKDAYKRKKKVVVEGVQLLDDTLRPDKTYFQDKPVIMLNTNTMTSIYRGNKRDGKKFSINDVKNAMQWKKEIKNVKKNNSLKHNNLH